MSAGDFYSLLFRMKHIDRWGLMRTVFKENLAEHSMEVAVLAHALATIGNVKLGKTHDCEHIALASLFHDMNEILTGDLPTPVKYYNDDIRTAYKKIEETSREKMLSLLDEDLQESYRQALQVTPEQELLIKAADRLCAYLKCADEIKHANNDFSNALQSTRQSLEQMECPELKYFIEHYLSCFEKTLDQITL